MTQINIRGIKDNSNDLSYRYKMDKMILKTESNKTVITNLSKICKDIDRDEKTLLNFFGKSFGCGTNFDSKTNKSTINKEVNLSDLESKLFMYIEKHVLCETCGNPETVIDKVKKKKTCKACGNSSKLK